MGYSSDLILITWEFVIQRRRCAVTYGLNSSALEGAHKTLGDAYQYLGNYDAALYHLKQGQRLFEPMDSNPFGNELAVTAYAKNIAAIETGTPIHTPRSKLREFSLEGDFPSSLDVGSSEAAFVAMIIGGIDLIMLLSIFGVKTPML